MPTTKPQPGTDGRYHCTRAGCEDVRYELPQGLGAHMYHRHGVQGATRAHKPPQRALSPSKALDVIRKPKQPDMTPEVVCMTVLAELAPKGWIPIHALPTYTRWLASTGEMMEALG
jgi:hypothetical protein